MNAYLNTLIQYCEKHQIMNYVSKILKCKKFLIWSGSGKPQHHHYGDGGLLRHTTEVFLFCYDIATGYSSMCGTANKKINVRELLISAIWHDYGKIWDYQKDGNDVVWGKHNTHARRIHHISRSALEFEKHVDSLTPNKLCESINKDNIIHNILSHHGQREYGSPVAPATREAWILHLADNLSARLDDCEKHDIIKK